MDNSIYCSLHPQNLIALRDKLGGICSLNNVSGLQSLKYSLFLREPEEALHHVAIIQFGGFVGEEYQEVWHLKGQALIDAGITHLVVYGVDTDSSIARIEDFAKAREVLASCFGSEELDTMAIFIKQHLV